MRDLVIGQTQTIRAQSVPTISPESTAPNVATESSTLCVCGHQGERHDRIATRYCAATVDGRLERGCVCTDTEATD
jgi:hypothetical protein